MDSIVSFGYWVRRRRKTLDLTQVTLAQRVGCSVVTIRKIERDERRPSRQMAELLADHLLIPDAERDNYIRLARGEFVNSMTSPLAVQSLPEFLQTDEELPHQEDTPFVVRESELNLLDGQHLAQQNDGQDSAGEGKAQSIHFAPASHFLAALGLTPIPARLRFVLTMLHFT